MFASTQGEFNMKPFGLQLIDPSYKPVQAQAYTILDQWNSNGKRKLQDQWKLESFSKVHQDIKGSFSCVLKKNLNL